MALIKCPECGKSISDKASKCPHCGIPSEYFCNVNTDAVNHDLIMKWTSQTSSMPWKSSIKLRKEIPS